MSRASSAAAAASAARVTRSSLPWALSGSRRVNRFEVRVESSTDDVGTAGAPWIPVPTVNAPSTEVGSTSS